MSRIAEALKKAEHERRERGDRRSPCPVAGDASADASVGEQAPPGPAVPRAQPVRSVVEGMSESLITHYDPSSLIAEQYRSLRTRLLSMNPQNDHRVLAVTSAVPKEGKSVTVLNLAFSLAELQHLRVLVLDCDFRRGSLARLFNRPEAPGLADLLRGDASLNDVVQPVASPNLFFVPAGRTNGHRAAELLASEAMASVTHAVQDQYHYALIDTPPATTVTDVGIIGQLCHCAIMVIRMNRTPDPVVRRAVRLLQVNNVPVAGCILVGRSERNSRYGYYYGYYSPGRYRDYYNDDGDD
jgi:capsular exopolysaccharide synthesis family protein